MESRQTGGRFRRPSVAGLPFLKGTTLMMQPYKYPSWLMDSGRIRERAITETALQPEALPGMKNACWQLHEQNVAQYQVRHKAWLEGRARLIEAFGAQHELVRKIGRTPPEQPLQIMAFFDKFEAKVWAEVAVLQAQERRRQQDRFRRAALRAENSDNDYWFRHDHNEYAGS